MATKIITQEVCNRIVVLLNLLYYDFNIKYAADLLWQFTGQKLNFKKIAISHGWNKTTLVRACYDLASLIVLDADLSIQQSNEVIRILDHQIYSHVEKSGLQ